MPLDLHTRADLSPATLNREKRTVEAVLTTGAPVQRFGFDGPFTEKLDVRAEAVDLSRMPVPVLDGHRQDGVSSILGTLLSVRFEAGKMIGTIRISARHSALLDDIAAGDIRSVSIGYTVEQYEDRVGPDGQKVRTGARWTLAELSFVSVPADPLATIRSQTMTTQTAAAPAVPTPPPAVQTRAEIDVEIRALFTSQALPVEQADILVNSGATVEQARAAAQWAVAQRQAAQPPRVTAVHHLDSPETVVARMGEAIYARVNPRHKLSDAARPYAGLTTLDMARDCLAQAGIATAGLTPADTITRASAGLHTTNDFPAIFGNAVNRMLRAGYETAPVTLKQVARQTTARDFRAKTAIQRGEAPMLEKVNENGEFKSGTIDEAKETYALATYGKIFGLTRQAMINDDLGAFTDMAGHMARGAADTEAQLLVDLLERNTGLGPTMDDTVNLFATAHGNTAATGAIISETTVSAARLALRTQKGIGKRPINVPPKYLLVHPAQETAAEKFLAAINPSQTSNVNPFSGKLELLVEARLSSTIRWYVIADPAAIDGLEYAYLQGEEGPQVETKAGFEVDGMQFKVRLDFGAGFLDWRSWFMNPGA
ncbi:MAG: HK97 family phage prohead protease [Proteobacteria bacterium]|nr:HK97 family phage prohead protease [Pseudomonadota bacterium]